MKTNLNHDDSENLVRRIEESTNRVEKITAQWQQGGFDKVITSAFKKTQRQMERQLTNIMRDTLLSAFGGGGGAHKGAITSLIGSIIPGFARGGVIGSRKVVVGAGEAGPEVILPLRKGADGRLGVVATNPKATPSSPRPIEVTIKQDSSSSSVVADDALTEAVASAVISAIDDAIDDRIALHLRPGGMLEQTTFRG